MDQTATNEDYSNSAIEDDDEYEIFSIETLDGNGEPAFFSCSFSKFSFHIKTCTKNHEIHMI